MGKDYEITVRISADGKAEIVGSRQALDRMERSAVNVGDRFRDINMHLNRMFNKLGAVGRKMTLLGTVGVAGVAGMLGYGMKMADTLNTMEAGLTGVVGNLESAREITTELSNLATEGPFGLIDVMNLGSGLTYMDKYFTDMNNLKKSVLVFEDLAAGMVLTGLAKTNEEALERTNVALMRFLGSGGEQVGRLRMALPMISEKIKEKIKPGDMGSVVDALQEELDRLHFTGSAEKLENTFSAKWSNLMGKFQIGLGRALTPLLDTVLGFLDELAEMGALDTIVEIFTDVAKYAGELFEFMKPFIMDFLEFVKGSDVVKKILAFAIMLGPPLLIVGGLILQIVGALGGMVTSFALLGAVGASAGPALAIIAGIIIFIIETLAVLAGATVFMIAGFKSMSDKSKGKLKELGIFVKFFVGSVFDFFKWLFSKINPLINKSGDLWEKVFGTVLDVIISTFEKMMGFLAKLFKFMDSINEFLGLGKPFEEVSRAYDEFKTGLERKEKIHGRLSLFETGVKGMGRKVWEKYHPGIALQGEGGGLGGLDLENLGGGGGGGAGGGGGGGVSKGLGGNIMYITIEKLIAEVAGELNEASLSNMVGRIVERQIGDPA